MNRKQIKATLYEENDTDFLKFEISKDCILPVNLKFVRKSERIKSSILQPFIYSN